MRAIDRDLLGFAGRRRFRTILADDAHGIYAFERDLGPSHIYFALNRSNTATSVQVPIEDKGPLIDWLDPSQSDLVQSDAEQRPILRPKGSSTSIAPHGGVCTVEIGPWGSVLLTSKPNAN